MQQGGIFNTLDKYADKYEPTASMLSLGGLGLGGITAATGIGAPIGGAIAVASQVPSTVIDGYQTARDWYKTAKGDNRAWSAFWNTVETGLDLAGAKVAKTLSKGVIGLVEPNVFNPRKPLFSPKKRIADHYRKQWEYEKAKRTAAATKELAKKGVRPSQGNYFKTKMNQFLDKEYQKEKQKAIAKNMQYVPKVSSTMLYGINGIPNIIDINTYNK